MPEPRVPLEPLSPGAAVRHGHGRACYPCALGDGRLWIGFGPPGLPRWIEVKSPQFWWLVAGTDADLARMAGLGVTDGRQP